MATKFLNSGSVPDYLQEHYGIKAKPRTLDEWATRGGGPPFHKFGKFRTYPVEQLDAWAAARLGPLVNSTSELAASAA